MKLKGRTALVTGGANGIGAAIVESLADAGATVYSLDLATPPAAASMRHGVHALQGDVGRPDDIAQAFAAIDQAGGGIDIVVHNAGIQRAGLCGQLSHADWSAVLRTHLDGMFLCASAAIPRMSRQGRGGSIVAISSAAAFVGLPGRAAYTAAKAGLVGLARCLAVETAAHGIRVNTVAPGFTQTPLIERAMADGSLSEARMLERVPAGRLARPEDIATAVRFLCSDDATYVMGQTLVVDGGWTAQGIGNAPGWLRQETASTDTH
mgnify:FL=1